MRTIVESSRLDNVSFCTTSLYSLAQSLATAASNCEPKESQISVSNRRSIWQSAQGQLGTVVPTSNSPASARCFVNRAVTRIPPPTRNQCDRFWWGPSGSVGEWHGGPCVGTLSGPGHSPCLGRDDSVGAANIRFFRSSTNLATASPSTHAAANPNMVARSEISRRLDF
jgi:hypothetical protein